MIKILVVGLGNPGDEFNLTRHNVGFACIDALAKRLDASDWRNQDRLKAEIGEAHLAQSEISFVLAKPLTFMNESGQSVRKMADFYDLKAESIWVIHDELDLPFGLAELRRGGGLAGHNGLKSVVQHLGTDDFYRVRIGVRGDTLREEHREQGIDGRNFVLGRFTKEEQVHLPELFELIGHSWLDTAKQDSILANPARVGLKKT